MQKQEDKKLERRLHQVMEQIQPDEDAKDRMYLEIMRRASVAETPPAKPKPWYLRWQTSAGACTAALLCVVVVAAAVHGRMPQGGTGQLDIVSPTVTTQASELPADTEQPDETETRPQTETTAAETGVTVHSAEMPVLPRKAVLFRRKMKSFLRFLRKSPCRRSRSSRKPSRS